MVLKPSRPCRPLTPARLIYASFKAVPDEPRPGGHPTGATRPTGWLTRPPRRCSAVFPDSAVVFRLASPFLPKRTFQADHETHSAVERNLHSRGWTGSGGPSTHPTAYGGGRGPALPPCAPCYPEVGRGKLLGFTHFGPKACHWLRAQRGLASAVSSPEEARRARKGDRPLAHVPTCSPQGANHRPNASRRGEDEGV